MSLYIRDDSVDELARELQQLTKARSKTEAVRQALENEIARKKHAIPLAERIRPIQERVVKRIGPNPPPFDMKKFMDEMWDID